MHFVYPGYRLSAMSALYECNVALEFILILCKKKILVGKHIKMNFNVSSIFSSFLSASQASEKCCTSSQVWRRIAVTTWNMWTIEKHDRLACHSSFLLHISHKVYCELLLHFLLSSVKYLFSLIFDKSLYLFDINFDRMVLGHSFQYYIPGVLYSSQAGSKTSNWQHEKQNQKLYGSKMYSWSNWHT